jgi:hypothetical protein
MSEIQAQGTPLAAYAAVIAHLAEGIPLTESLAYLGIAADRWPAIEDTWLDRLAEGDPALLDAFDEHRAAAAREVLRPLPPLDEELGAWTAFFRAFTAAEDPLGFLAAREMREADVFRLLARWQARLSEEPALRESLAALLCTEDRVPEVRPCPPRLPERPVPVVVDTPKPAVQTAPAALAETRPVFWVDAAVLPFDDRSPWAPPPPSPSPKRDAPPPARPPSSLGETQPAFLFKKPALPFEQEEAPKSPGPGALGETAPVFRVELPVVPFDPKAAPALPAPTPAVARVPASLGETAPAFRNEKPALPFEQGAPPAPPPPAPGNLLAETSLDLNLPLQVLPFAKAKPRLSIEAYAAMCAEIWLYPAQAMATIARYGLSPEAKRAEDAAWQARFAEEPGLRESWSRLSIEAGARLRQR